MSWKKGNDFFWWEFAAFVSLLVTAACKVFLKWKEVSGK